MRASNPLASGDEIPLERTGRNPEVEEVLGALSLLLNGGGVAQLKTITQELNQALEGREGTARSVLRQVRDFMGQLDDNKADIVDAIEKLNRLALGIRKEQPTIDAALDELPSALDSIDRQREDLVDDAAALEDLSAVGVKVIRASKEATIDSLRGLDPVLTQLAASGDDFTNAFHVFLTYPFVDEVVGRDPQVARNLHMGDYTNLSITLEVDLSRAPPGCRRCPTNLPTQIDPTVIVNNVLDCLASGDLTSPACQKVLASAHRPARARSEECRKERQQGQGRLPRAQPGCPTCRCPPRRPPARRPGPAAQRPRPAGAAGRAGPAGPAPRSGRRRTDVRTADGRLRPRPGEPARPRDGAAMITRRTKVQLLVFALITLLGVSYVGARYARLDRVFVDDTYTVVAHFADSGGAFAGAEVSYRGVRVGEVDELVLTDDGVDIHLDIDNEQDRIPADSLALVGNRSAVGEQYVELQPQVDDGPYLQDGSEIAVDRTTHPDPDRHPADPPVRDRAQRRRGGPADRHHRVRRRVRRRRARTSRRSSTPAAPSSTPPTPTSRSPPKLIRDGNVVLNGQIDSESALRSFARDLALFSTSLAGSDKDLRR